MAMFNSKSIANPNSLFWSHEIPEVVGSQSWSTRADHQGFLTGFLDRKMSAPAPVMIRLAGLAGIASIVFTFQWIFYLHRKNLSLSNWIYGHFFSRICGLKRKLKTRNDAQLFPEDTYSDWWVAQLLPSKSVRFCAAHVCWYPWETTKILVKIPIWTCFFSQPNFGS